MQQPPESSAVPPPRDGTDATGPQDSDSGGGIKTEFRGYLDLADRDNAKAMQFIRQTLNQRATQEQQQQQQQLLLHTATSSTLPSLAPVVATQRKSVVQRQRSRANQRRFRDKESSKQYNLMLDVNQLKQQIADLERRRQVLRLLRTRPPPLIAGAANANATTTTTTTTTTSTTTTMTTTMTSSSPPSVSVVRQPTFKNHQLLKTIFYYYQLFQKGLSTPNYSDSLATKTFREKQITFFKRLFAPHVARGDVLVSVDVLLEQWERLGKYYSGYDMQIKSTEMIDLFPDQSSCIVIVRVVVKYFITRATLVNVFPRVLENPKLLAQVLGQPVEMPMETNYFVDLSCNQVVRIAVTMDLVTAITNVVHKAEKTMQVLHGALITGNFFLGHWKQHVFEQLPGDHERRPGRAHAQRQKSQQDTRHAQNDPEVAYVQL